MIKLIISKKNKNKVSLIYLKNRIHKMKTICFIVYSKIFITRFSLNLYNIILVYRIMSMILKVKVNNFIMLLNKISHKNNKQFVVKSLKRKRISKKQKKMRKLIQKRRNLNASNNDGIYYLIFDNYYVIIYKVYIMV